MRVRPSQSLRPLTLALTLGALLATAPGARAGEDLEAARPDLLSPLHRFVQRSLDARGAAQDSLAGSFGLAQLPLLAQGLSDREAAQGIDAPRLYAAIARWHFWMGKRWDDHNRGLWSADPVWLPVTGDPPGGTLSVLAALEMVQLGALSEMALRRGYYLDALIWSDERARLARRLAQTLHDPLAGAYADLDSTGHRRESVDRLSALLPVALDAPFVRERGRHLARRIWCGVEPGAELGAPERMHALAQAERLHGWTSDAGLHLLSPDLTAALALSAVERTGDVLLRPLVRDALASAGLAVGDSVRLHLGAWTVAVDPRAVAPGPLHDARLALGFLRAGGLVGADEADSLLGVLYEGDLDDPSRHDALVGGLTDRLVEWRARGWRDALRRSGLRAPYARALAPEGSIFHWSEADVEMWADRALDRLTAAILAHHLRPHPEAAYRAEFEPSLVGRGDATTLVLDPLRADLGGSSGWTVAWSDGARLLSPRPVSLHTDPNGSARIELDTVPAETGIWHAVIEGPRGTPLFAPAMAVVEPLRAELQPAAAPDQRYVLQLHSQVRQPTRGRVELELPLTWDPDPNPPLYFEVEPGSTTRLEVRLRNDEEAAPALYPTRWVVFDSDELIAELHAEVAVHFRWLRLGALAAEDPRALDTPLPPDRRVDLAERLDGIDGATRWSRLAEERLRSDGWIELASAADDRGAHFALTAFTTTSRDVVVSLESNVPAVVRLNGRDAVRLPQGGRDRGDANAGAGANLVLVKLVGGGGVPARFRLQLRDVDGEPLRGVSNALEHLLEGYAYVSGAEDARPRNAVAVQREQMRLVTLTYRNPEAQRVSVVGNFNGWSPTASPMMRVGDGRWEAKIRLRPGRFQYKFAVDGANWIADPINPLASGDGFGGRNSVIVVE